MQQRLSITVLQYGFYFGCRPQLLQTLQSCEIVKFRKGGEVSLVGGVSASRKWRKVNEPLRQKETLSLIKKNGFLKNYKFDTQVHLLILKLDLKVRHFHMFLGEGRRETRTPLRLDDFGLNRFFF